MECEKEKAEQDCIDQRFQEEAGARSSTYSWTDLSDTHRGRPGVLAMSSCAFFFPNQKDGAWKAH